MTKFVSPLFVFGTLMDPDVLQLVSGMGLSELILQPAVVSGYKRRLVQGEDFPVLVAAAENSVSGLLVQGLSDEAMRRAQFFEGDEYVLKQIQPCSLPGSHASFSSSEAIDAVYFADNGVYDIENIDWNIQTWQDLHKDEFLPRLRSYMGFFGSLSTAEADQHW